MEIEKFIETNRFLLNQLPGMVFIANEHSVIKFLNRGIATVFGFTHPENAVDQIYENIPCKISENASDYIHDDQIAMKNEQLSFMTYHCFSEKSWRLVLGERKCILNQDGEGIGVMVSVQDVTHSGVIDLARFLLSVDRLNGCKIKQRYFSYYLDLNKNNLHSDFPDRQQECLFYFLRGYTSKTIAKQLSISSRTVEFHLEQLKLKFNVSKKSNLIEKAILMGYYNYLPPSLLSMRHKD